MKKLFFVALVTASLFACGGKKKDDTMKKDTGSAMGSDTGSAAGSGDAGSGSAEAPPAGGG